MTGALRRGDRSLRPDRAAHLAIAAVALGLLVTLTVLVVRGAAVVTAFDDGAAAAAGALLDSSGGARAATAWLAGKGSSLLLGAGVLALVLLLVARRRARETLWVLAAIVAQYVAEAVLTGLVARPLPPGAAEIGYGFPSGHTASATVVLVLLVAVLRTGRAPWWLLVVAGVLLVAAVGASRVLASAHHATDVLGGALLGLLVAAPVAPLVTGAAYRWPRHDQPEEP